MEDFYVRSVVDIKSMPFQKTKLLASLAGSLTFDGHGVEPQDEQRELLEDRKEECEAEIFC